MTPLYVAAQIDPLDKLKPDTDNTLYLMEAAAKRGHHAFLFEPESVTYDQGRLTASAQRLQPGKKPSSDAARETLDISRPVDVLLLRDNPPFAERHATNTYLFETLDDVLFVNHPRALRTVSSKLTTLTVARAMPDAVPATMVTRDTQAVLAFLDHHRCAIVKPLYDFGGRGIAKIEIDGPWEEAVERLKRDYPDAFMVQECLEAAAQGDKRVIAIDGEPYGAVLRVPKKGSTVANISQGGSIEPAEVTPWERRIVTEVVAPLLKEAGVFLAGLDFIGGKLTEVNVHTPGALRALAHFGQDVAGDFWHRVEVARGVRRE